MTDMTDRTAAMVQAYIDGYRIRCIGGLVYKFKQGAEDSGEAIMNSTDAARSRDELSRVGIKMGRIDAGGSPEWEFTVARE